MLASPGLKKKSALEFTNRLNAEENSSS